MKRAWIAAAVLMVAALTGQGAQAGPYSDAFGKCLADNSTGRDRVIFVRWMFAALASHPDLASLSKVSEGEREAITRDMAGIVNRLVLVDCRKEAVDAMQNEGQPGFVRGFESFGKLAARELMGNPIVSANMDGFTKYIDEDAWTALAKEANQGSKQKF